MVQILYHLPQNPFRASQKGQQMAQRLAYEASTAATQRGSDR